ncbi:MAG: hypothetical protein R3B13_36085 [Polyangiaceae bacterium]
MLRKALKFKREQTRPTPKPPQKKKKKKPSGVDTSLPGVSASDKRAGAGSTAARNFSKASARKAAFALEDSKSDPSRKSTRKSSNRQKPDSQLKRRTTRRATAPASRARRGK